MFSRGLNGLAQLLINKGYTLDEVQMLMIMCDDCNYGPKQIEAFMKKVQARIVTEKLAEQIEFLNDEDKCNYEKEGN